MIDEVDAGAERLALTRQDDRTHRGIAVERCDGLRDGMPERTMQRVQLVGAVETQCGHGARALDGQVGKWLGHAVLPRSR